jgi:hypothetical protein
MIYTNIIKEDLINYQKILPTITMWDKSNQPELWSKERIDGSSMYKVHRRSSKIIDETGLFIQKIVYDNYYDKKTIFPFYYQIIKFNNKINSKKNIENSICQTFTFLNGKDVQKTVIVKPEEDFEYRVKDNTYALAISWSENFNPKDPKLFIKPYYRLFM